MSIFARASICLASLSWCNGTENKKGKSVLNISLLDWVKKVYNFNKRGQKLPVPICPSDKLVCYCVQH